MPSVPAGGYTRPAPKTAPPRVTTTTDVIEHLTGLDPQEVIRLQHGTMDEIRKVRERMKPKRAELATYKARHWGSNSFWEHERTAFMARLAQAERLRRTEKVSDAELDKWVRANPEYLDYLNRGLKEREQMERLQAEIAELQDELDTLQGVLQNYRDQARLNDAIIRFEQNTNRE